jgi:prepilin-type processing-associated H-X9-DG protein
VYNGASKSSDLLIPGPARTWVFMDEHPDSISDGAGWPPNTSSNMPDLPATYHNGAASFAMADGHSEMHRWRGPKMNTPINENGALGVGFSSLNNSATVRGDPDLFWLSFSTPRSSNKTVVDWGRN